MEKISKIPYSVFFEELVHLSTTKLPQNSYRFFIVEIDQDSMRKLSTIPYK